MFSGDVAFFPVDGPTELTLQLAPGITDASITFRSAPMKHGQGHVLAVPKALAERVGLELHGVDTTEGKAA